MRKEIQSKSHILIGFFYNIILNNLYGRLSILTSSNTEHMSFKKTEKQESSRIAMMNNDMAEDYMEDKITKIKEEDIEIVLANEKAITTKIRDAKPLKKFTEIGKVLFSMLRDFSTGRYPNTPWFTIATLAMVLLYILNPLDLIPDFIPVVGYLDDLAVLTIGMGWIETDIHKYLDWRIKEAKRKNE